MSFNDKIPPFYDEKHVSYITSLAKKLDSPKSYEGAVTEHLRMSGVYWSIAALSLLRLPSEVDSDMSLNTLIVDWVFSCYDEVTGGFGGNTRHDAHLLYTLSAIQILAMADMLDDERLDKIKVGSFIANLQQDDGSFAGDEWGEIDTRFSYCALSGLSLLGLLQYDQPTEEGNPCRIDIEKAAKYVASCRNFDGGFGCVPGAESHAGQVFTCIGALSIAKHLHLLGSDSTDLLSWWLSERQCDSGGLNGRPEKQADVCYSWWILSSLSILGRVDWINKSKLARFILKCQDNDDGGIADRPDDMPDVFHTFFGISGLSLLGYLHEEPDKDDEQQLNESESSRSYRMIDPVYALPTDVVKKLGLGGQIMTWGEEHDLEERLRMYDILDFSSTEQND